MSPDSTLAATLESKAQLLGLLADDPALATPSLARDLWRRVVRLHKSDARAARELAECAWLVAERAGDQRSCALGHRALALAALAAGHQRDVLAHYESAERLHRELGEEVERARVLRSMIDPLMHLGRYDEALATADEAGRVLREHGEVLLAAQVEANVGNVHHRLGRDAESLDAYGRALSAFRTAGDEDAAAVLEFNRANVFAERGELGEAERGYRRALRHYRARGERLRESQCRYQLAYLAFLGGRYSEALRGIESVRRSEKDLGDERHAALCMLDEAELLLSLNAWEEARDRAAQAHEELAGLGLAQDAIRAALFLGLGALHLRRWEEAAARLGEARIGFESEGNAVLAALASLYQAELWLRRREPAAAFDAARSAARAFQARGLAAKEGYARIVAGRALAALGRTAFAARQAEAALVQLARVPSGGISWRAHALLADLTADPRSRRVRIEAAIEAAEETRAGILPDELQAAFHRDKVELYGSLALCLLADPPAPREAFEVIESARARVLAERLAADPGSGDRADRLEEARGPMRRAVEELNALYRRLNEVERESASRALAEPLRVEIARRERALAGLRRSAQLHRGTGAVTTAPSRDTLSGLAEILKPGESLVAYAFLREELHAFVVDRGGVAWTGPIAGRAEVEDALDRWVFQAGKTALGRKYMERQHHALAAGALRALARLHGLVWEPLRPHLDGDGAIVVVPSGPLFYLPFHALWDGHSHLIEQRQLSTAPSARALIALHRRGGREPVRRAGVLVLGYEVAGLPAIAREIEAVSAAFPEAVVLTGHAATRKALRSLGGQAAIVHLAAHGELRDDNPLLSSIELADGRLTFYDLFDLRLGAELVVLSGCQTGHGRILEGDELMGLARGFQYAGARSLVASLWPVEDEAAAEFMGGFYSAIADRRGIRQAIARTMRERIAMGRLPHEWAPFYLSGWTSEEALPS